MWKFGESVMEMLKSRSDTIILAVLLALLIIVLIVFLYKYYSLVSDRAAKDREAERDEKRAVSAAACEKCSERLSAELERAERILTMARIGTTDENGYRIRAIQAVLDGRFSDSFLEALLKIAANSSKDEPRFKGQELFSKLMWDAQDLEVAKAESALSVCDWCRIDLGVGDENGYKFSLVNRFSRLAGMILYSGNEKSVVHMHLTGHNPKSSSVTGVLQILEYMNERNGAGKYGPKLVLHSVGSPVYEDAFLKLAEYKEMGMENVSWETE